MEFYLDTISLLSRDPSRLRAFLCDVFEFDLDTISEVVSKGFVKFSIVKSHKSNDALAKDEYFFNVSTSENISELTSKFNFFIYRNPSVLECVESMETDDNNVSIVLLFTDVDKRKWHFRYTRGEN